MANAMKDCINCGESIFRSAQICPHCGTKQGVAPQSVAPNANPGFPAVPHGQPSKDKNAAAILAVFLGGIGAHHFYLGNVGRGVLYLLFSWTFIPAVVGVIEGIVYFTTADNSWLAQYPPVTYR